MIFRGVADSSRSYRYISKLHSPLRIGKTYAVKIHNNDWSFHQRLLVGKIREVDEGSGRPTLNWNAFSYDIRYEPRTMRSFVQKFPFRAMMQPHRYRAKFLGEVREGVDVDAVCKCSYDVPSCAVLLPTYSLAESIIARDGRYRRAASLFRNSAGNNCVTYVRRLWDAIKEPSSGQVHRQVER